MTAATPIRLSDDEVVAVAVARRVAWPTALPSVRKTGEGLREAAFRGARSLMLRADSVTEHDLEATAARVLGDHRSVVTTPVAGTPDEPGVQVVLHECADEVVAERITADGVHEFRVMSGAEAVELLVTVVLDSGVPVDVEHVDGHTGLATAVSRSDVVAAGGRAETIRLLATRLPLVATFLAPAGS